MANTFLAADLEPYKGGKDCVAFTVAINRRRQVNDKWENGSSSFHRCVVWQDQAQQVLDDLRKGTRVVLVSGLMASTYRGWNLTQPPSG